MVFEIPGVLRFPCRKANGKEPAGFTLLEVVVVLLLVTLLAGGTTYACATLLRQQLLALTGVEVLQDLRLAQEEAFSTGETVRIWFYNDGYLKEGPGPEDRCLKHLPPGVEFYASTIYHPQERAYHVLEFRGSTSTFGNKALALKSGPSSRFIRVNVKGRLILSDKPTEGGFTGNWEKYPDMKAEHLITAPSPYGEK
ncbi:MAG TPA: prepilin-type N-terminal cleavage/methylation domain-containing protein [Moorella mulderi]|nr:prepilin-type N-terminal cleavage/methylation domain-containing protein [Moorella mulderi]